MEKIWDHPQNIFLMLKYSICSSVSSKSNQNPKSRKIKLFFILDNRFLFDPVFFPNKFNTFPSLPWAQINPKTFQLVILRSTAQVGIAISVPRIADSLGDCIGIRLYRNSMLFETKNKVNETFRIPRKDHRSNLGGDVERSCRPVNHLT